MSASSSASPHVEILQSVNALRQNSGVAAAVVVLVRDDAVTCDALGVVNHASGEPATLEHFVRIGSITKAFTGLALLAAAERDRIDLNAPVRSWLDPPPFDNPWSADRPVTLAMLMEHTAGLGELSKTEWDSATPMPLAEALALDPGSRKLRWKPGTFSVYSNAGSGVAAYAVEKKLDVDFEAWVDQTVFTPLGMDSATFHPVEPLLSGYDRDGKTPIVYWHQLYRPFGAINVQPCEMARFLRMLIGQGELDRRQIFRASTISRMETPRTSFAARRGLRHGYGFGNYSTIVDGRVWHGHGGDADGYLSHYAYNRDCRCGYFTAITAFQHTTLRKIRRQIEDYLDPPIPTAAVPRENASIDPSWFGRYIQSARRFPGSLESLTLEPGNGEIWMRSGQESGRLMVSAPHLLMRPGDPIATIAIGEEEGKVYLQGPFGDFEKDLEDSVSDPPGETRNPTDNDDP